MINKESKSVSVEVYKGKNYIKKSRKFNVTPNRSLSEGDELKIGPGFAGFVSGGKFHNLKSYGRYSSISTSKPTNVSSAKNGKDSLKNQNR